VKSKLLVLGAHSQVGVNLCRLLDEQQIEFAAVAANEIDLCDRISIDELFAKHTPTLIINSISFSARNQAELEQQRCIAINATGAETVAKACADYGATLLHLSTCDVFDGKSSIPYGEESATSPVGVYGESKYQGEQAILRELERHIILRLGWVFSTHRDNFIRSTIAMTSGDPVLVDLAYKFCPTAAADVARVIVAMTKQLETGAKLWGVYHYCSSEVTSRYDFAKAILGEASKYDEDLVDKSIPQALGVTAEQTKNYLFSCKKLLDTFGIKQHPWRSELVKAVREVYAKRESELESE